MVCKSCQKRADVLNFGWPGPVSYALYFYWVHACHPLFNDYPQIIYSRCMEDTFLWFEIKIVSFCKFEDFGDACDVVCFIGTGCDGNVIHVFFDFGSFGCPLLFDWSKNPIHHRLEGRQRVTKAEKHHHWFPQPVLHLECCFVLVAFLNLYIIISPADIEFCENVCSCEAGRKVSNEGQGVLVFNSVGIEVTVVLYGS